MSYSRRARPRARAYMPVPNRIPLRKPAPAAITRRPSLRTIALSTCGILAIGLSVSSASPIEYVKVCSLYGVDYSYLPGTDTCAVPATTSLKGQSAYGTITNTVGTNATAFGGKSFAYGDESMALGNNTWAGGDPTSASPGAGGNFNLNIGGMLAGSAFFNSGTTAIGNNARAGAGADGQTNATAVGESATANAIGASAFGQGSNASGDYSMAFGMSSAANASKGVALGYNASVSSGATNAVAIGAELRGEHRQHRLVRICGERAQPGQCARRGPCRHPAPTRSMAASSTPRTRR